MTVIPPPKTWLPAALIALATAGSPVALGAIPRGPSHARTRYSIEIEALYTAAGNPSLSADFSSLGAAPLRWSICRPQRPDLCTSARRRGRQFNPGPSPAGTVFEVTTSYRGHLYTARTARWLGTVHPRTPPRLTGEPRYRSSISATRGTWVGGWLPDPSYKPPPDGLTGGHGPSFDLVTIEACRTRDAHGCVNLTPPAYGPTLGARRVTIGSAITGRYLFAYDARYGPDTAVVPDTGYPNAASVPVVHAGRTIARSVRLGPITGPPRPSVTLLRTAHARHGRVAVAQIRSSVPCRVLVLASSGPHDSAARRTVRGPAPVTVTVPWKTSYGDRLAVKLFVGDGPRLESTTRVTSANPQHEPRHGATPRDVTGLLAARHTDRKATLRPSR